MGKADVPGYSLGFPMYHALTGNLPVLSKELHCPPGGEVGQQAAAGPSSWHHVTGNLPALSHELHHPDAMAGAAGSSFAAAGLRRPAAASAGAGAGAGAAAAPAGEEWPLMPGWVRLIDPLTKRPFWWNTLYRSRRDARPGPSDDGRRVDGAGASASGAGSASGQGPLLSAAYTGVSALSLASTASNASDAPTSRYARIAACLAARTWRERWDPVAGRPFYWNTRTNATQWARPPDFWWDGVPYRPVWGIVEAGDGSGEVVAVNRVTGDSCASLPDGYDGGYAEAAEWIFEPPQGGSLGGAGSVASTGVWRNWATGETSEGVPYAVAVVEQAPAPGMPPPTAPAASGPGSMGGDGASSAHVGGAGGWPLTQDELETYAHVLEALGSGSAAGETDDSFDAAAPHGGLDEDPSGSAGGSAGGSQPGSAGGSRHSSTASLGGVVRVTYPHISGPLRKKGGGHSLFFGSTRWQERWVVSEGRQLRYYASEADAVAGKPPLKGAVLHLATYGVHVPPAPAVTASPSRGAKGSGGGDAGGWCPFSLVPRPEALVAAQASHGGSAPPSGSERVYEFAAPTPAARAQWVAALKGVRSDGRPVPDAPAAPGGLWLSEAPGASSGGALGVSSSAGGGGLGHSAGGDAHHAPSAFPGGHTVSARFEAASSGLWSGGSRPPSLQASLPAARRASLLAAAAAEAVRRQAEADAAAEAAAAAEASENPASPASVRRPDDRRSPGTVGYAALASSLVPPPPPPPMGTP